MKQAFRFHLKLLTSDQQEQFYCNLPSPLHVAIYDPLFNGLELKKDALLLGKSSIVNVTILTLNLPTKLGTYRDCFGHEDLKAFFKDGEEVFLLNFYDLENFDKFKVIKPNKIYPTQLMETISLKFPKNLQRFAIPGQYYYGINRGNDQIWKFELIGFSNKFEISDKRDGISSITYLVAADKTYDAIMKNLEARKISEPKDVINDIKAQEKVLKDKFSRKILEFYRDHGAMPNHLDLVSDKIGIPLGYEKNVLHYMFGPLKLNLEFMTPEELKNLEKNGKRILAYVSKKRMKAKEGQELWHPMISDIVFDLKMDIEDVRLAFEYINMPITEFVIKPDEIAEIDKLSKIIINMSQKNNQIPSLYEVIDKGMSIEQAKKAFKVSDAILKTVFPMWENELQIPKLLFPVDELVSEHLDQTKEAPVSVGPKIQNFEITPEDTLELQITKARFQRATEVPIIFVGNPEIFLKKSKSLIENELAFAKVKENIMEEGDSYSGDLLYAYLDKKKQLHFSVQISVDGNLIDETIKADLIVKSNDISVADRFFNIFFNRLEELESEITKDHFLKDTQDILQMVKSFGKGKNWTNIEEITIRLKFSPDRAQRILDYMEQQNLAKKVERASTGVRYYFPGLT